jgi:hypothetical protein
MERFNRTREEWEKLYWDGAPRAPDQDPVAQRPIDHYQDLGLRKYVIPYSSFINLNKNRQGDNSFVKIVVRVDIFELLCLHFPNDIAFDV